MKDQNDDPPQSVILERVYMCGEKKKKKKGGFTPSRTLGIYLYIEQIGNWHILNDYYLKNE